jgi:hypothetical protein
LGQGRSWRIKVDEPMKGDAARATKETISLRLVRTVVCLSKQCPNARLEVRRYLSSAQEIFNANCSQLRAGGFTQVLRDPVDEFGGALMIAGAG